MDFSINLCKNQDNSLKTTDSSASCLSLDKIYLDALDLLKAKVGRASAISACFRVPLVMAGIASTGITLSFALAMRTMASSFLMSVTTIKIIGFALGVFGAIGNIPLSHRFYETICGYLNQDINRIIENSTRNAKNALIIETSDWDINAPSEQEISSSYLIQLWTKIDGISHRSLRLPSYRFNLQMLGKTHAIKHIVSHSERQLKEALERVPDKSIDYLWIQGHGNKDEVSLGTNFSLDRSSDALFSLFAKKTRKNALIVLNGCSIGKEEYNIARICSAYFPKATVYAAGEKIGTIHGTELKENLIPYFTGPCSRENLTRSFRYGSVGQPVVFV